MKTDRKEAKRGVSSWSIGLIWYAVVLLYAVQYGVCDVTKSSQSNATESNSDQDGKSSSSANSSQTSESSSNGGINRRCGYHTEAADDLFGWEKMDLGMASTRRRINMPRGKGMQEKKRLFGSLRQQEANWMCWCKSVWQ